jgi:arsenate reductase-like glutaredoxin family protein
MGRIRNSGLNKACSYCRKVKTIVKTVQFLSYCEEHKHHAPTGEDVKRFLNKHQKESFVDWKKR